MPSKSVKQANLGTAGKALSRAAMASVIRGTTPRNDGKAERIKF